MLDRLLKISSLSGAVLIFCGVLKLILYYSAFNVKIVEFLSFSEIVTSFLDDINILLIYVIAMAIQSLPLINYLHRKSKLSYDEFYNAILLFIYQRKYKFVAFFVGVILILSILIATKSIGLNYFVIYVLIFCIIQLTTYVAMQLNEENKIEISDSSTTISLALTIIISIFLLAQHDIQETRLIKLQSTIHLAEKVIECDSKTGNLYLGKTDNFVFVRVENNQTICIPTSEIKQIDFR